jgi:putative SOS response-associated peptidase YedK
LVKHGEQIQALYRLTVPAAIPNFQPDYNVCPTDPADVVIPNENGRDLVRMRWGLVPYWWSKPLKELRLATFNARVETKSVLVFEDAGRCRIECERRERPKDPLSGPAIPQAPLMS